MVNLTSKRSTFCILFLIVFSILLTSCSTIKKRKDGPPNFYVDETKVPDAKPKPEKLSKYGNMPFYHVFGQRYYVMRNFKNYHEVGTASWYGTMFHNRRTSSGERYDMLGMTAAHRTLPLPTYVEVTNLKNNKKVIVKVNDRGPFASDRIIDLSYVAAKKLGMIGHGTARVEVRAIDPNRYGRPILLANRSSNRCQPGRFVYLQVGAFRDKTNALRLQQKLKTTLSAPIKITFPTRAIKLYRVQVGPLKDRGVVNAITQKLKSLGLKANKAYGV